MDLKSFKKRTIQDLSKLKLRQLKVGLFLISLALNQKSLISKPQNISNLEIARKKGKFQEL
jgi:hypothetical protein